MYMIYARFSVFLAVSVTYLGLAHHSFSFNYRGKNYLSNVAVAQTIETNSLTQIKPLSQAERVNFSALVANSIPEELNYDNYMQAGYQANSNKDYLTALKNFQNALALRPEDSLAQKAIRNVTSYAFDSLMQAGYRADKLREYQTALRYFRQAQDIKPDSFYAQQAIRNIRNYVSTTNVSDTTSELETDNSRVGFWLLFFGLFFALSVAGGILYLLFSASSSETEELTDQSLATEDETEVKTVITSTPTYPQVKPSTPTPEPQIITTTSENTLEGEQITEILSPEVNGGKLQPIEQPTIRQPNPYFSSSVPSQITKLDIIPELIEDLQQSDRHLRRKTIWELAQRADSRAMKPLVELMVKVDSQERSLILEAMTQIASRTLKPMNQALSLSLKDENSQVRQNAIRDLTRVYELMSQVTQRLSQAVNDSDEEVQQTAKWALKQLNQMPNSTWNNHNDL